MRFVFISFLLSTSLSSLAYAEVFLPKSNCDQLVEHSYYSICYDYNHKQALWTYHLLDRDGIKGRQKRTNDYRADHSIENPIGGRDYRGSGFDRGHLVPAGDMKYDRTSMSETFFMSNMSPQRSGFNSGIWRALEEGLRKEVLRRGPALVITAPVLLLEELYPRIRSGVSIPQFYYKVIYFLEDEVMKAYLIENKSQRGKSFRDFQVTVNEVEALTGIDFFSEFEDRLEEELESFLAP